MGLSLVYGPAHAGKVALLLDRFIAALDRDPWLIVPNRVDVDRVERELAGRRGALLAGTVGTFDALFGALAGNDLSGRVLGDAGRGLIVRHLVGASTLDAFGPSSRFAGFTDSLAGALTEIEANLLEPEDLGGDLGSLARAYVAELERRGVHDRGMVRRRAVARLTTDLGAWDGAPVFAYGFEDLTGAEWRLLEALAGRGEVHVSLPYEPGRAVFASLQRTAGDLGALANGEIVEMPAGSHSYLPGGIAYLERNLFEDARSPVPLDGSIRFLEGAGRRATLELLAETILDLVRDGVEPEEIAVVCPSIERSRASVETAFGTLGVPFTIEGRTRLGTTAFGQSLLSLLRFVWSDGTRRDLFAFLRTPYGGLGRSDVDFLEGRLRGRAVLRGERTLEEMTKLRTGRPLPILEALAAEDGALAAAAAAVETMLRHAYGLGMPPTTMGARRDLRAADAARAVLEELRQLAGAGATVTPDDILTALDRATVRGDDAGAPGRVAVLDLARARTRTFEAVFVIGLEQGSLPRRAPTSPFFDDETRRDLDGARGARLERPDTASRDRYLFYTACTRPRRLLTLVREAATDDGSPREASPFWEAVCELFEPDDVRRSTTRRPLARLTWPIEAAPTERERLRSLARLAADDPREADALAYANGWQRKLGRARRAFSRPTTITHPRAVALLTSRDTFRVTDLERMATCSSAWFVERYLRPGEIDQVIGPKMKGSIAHVALQRFYSQLPSAIPGAERVTPENVEAAVRLMHECVDGALDSGLRIDVGDLERRELGQGLRRDLEQLVRVDAAASSTFVPRKLEVSFKSYELAPGVAVSGKIDRVDSDPISARGIIIDYKSGAAPSASQIHDEARLQIPLYLLVVRDQLGLEPMGGVYVPVGGGRRARGMLRGGEDQVPGFASADYLDSADFDAEIDHARDTAVALAERIRVGDVIHDPHGGECPGWCTLWRICRKERP
ncbi:PD-(D/E)XK nuclease family protein [Gaiella sp.]|uniref:PD-(D/E)XK nuclease family protein n=1 Tax=Gaiella sp. TaxID=2663207 RepID=UPI00398304CD